MKGMITGDVRIDLRMIIIVAEMIMNIEVKTIEASV